MKALAAGVALHLAIAAASAATIAGRVTGPKGEPVAGASIAAYRVESPQDTTDRMMAGTKRSVLAKATSDTKGAFTLDVPIRGLFVLGVEASGFTPSFLEHDSDDATVAITLATGTVRDGSVVGPGGPVAGARVIIADPHGDIEVRTGADGRFHVPGRGWATALLVVHPDYAPATSTTSPNVTLVRGSPIAGRVVDPKGNAVAGARIRVGPFLRAVSASDGTFTIAHAVLPAAAITAETNDLFGTATLASNVTIKVRPTLSITGVLRDAQRNPIAGVTLTAFLSEEMRMSVTDEKGAYTLRHLSPGAWTLSGDGGDVYAIGEETRLDVKKSITHDLTVTRIPELIGTVRFEDGSPVANATTSVTLLFDNMEFAALREHGYTFENPERTDDGGRFHLRLSESDTPLVVAAMLPGLPPAHSEAITLKSGAPRPRLALTMPKGIEVLGSISDTAGRPLAGVVLAPQSDRGTVLNGETVWAESDADGRFSVRLPAADWGLHFSKDGFREESVPRVGTRRVKVTLQPTAEIRGRVTRRDGTPVAGVMVMVDGDHAVSAETRSDGTFALTGLPKGPTILRYMIRGGVNGTMPVTAPASDVRIVLGGQGKIRGRVVDGSGAPVSFFNVMVEPAERKFEKLSMPQQIVSDDGRFEVTDAPLGAVTLSIVAPGFLRMSRTLTIAEGEGTDAGTFVVSNGRTIRGLVTSTAGEPLAHVDVAVSRSDDSTAESVTSAENGSYELGSVSLGETMLSFSKRGFTHAERQIAAGSGDQSFNVQLAPGRVVTGRVLSAEGKPVAKAEVTARSAAYGAEYETQESDTAGAFRFDSLIAARYDFTAKDSATQLSGAATDVDVASTGEITIRLQPATRATIAGQVTGVDPASVLMARVEATVAGEDRSASAQIDAHGNYRIENAPAGTVTVQAMAGSRKGLRRSSAVTVDVSPGSEAHADLSFPPQVEVHGRVTLRGEPLPGAAIRFGSQNTGDGANVITGEGGTFDTVLASGSYQISIEASPIRGSYEVEREIRAGSSVDIDITMTNVAVTVVDAADGTPVAGAKVSTQDTPSPTHTADRGLTDAAGQIAFDAPAPPARIFVEKNGYATASVDGQTSPVVVKLTRSEGAVVRLIDARDGRTLSGYVIARDDAGHVLASGNEPAADGAVRLAILPGTYRFSASASEYGSSTVRAEVPAAEVRIPLRRGGRLMLRSNVDLRAYARLIQPDGEEYVRCWCSGIAEIRITGRATLVDSIAPGTYTLEVTPDGGKPRAYPVSVIEGQTVTVAMQ